LSYDASLVETMARSLHSIIDSDSKVCAKLKLLFCAGSNADACAYLEHLCFVASCLVISPEGMVFNAKATEGCFLEVWMRLRSVVIYCELFVLSALG